MVLINPRGLSVLAFSPVPASSIPVAPARPDLTGLMRQFFNENRFIGPMLANIVVSDGQSLDNTVGISCRLEKWDRMGSGYGPDLGGHSRVCDFYCPTLMKLPRTRPTVSYIAQTQSDRALRVPADYKPMSEKTEQKNLFCSPPDTDRTLDKLSETEEKGDVVFENLKFYASHAAAAYCNSPKEAGEPIRCTRNNNCPTLEGNNVTVLHSFRGGELDINGYVAVDPARGEVVISFRGSHSIQNWHANFDMGFLPYKSVSSTTAAPTDSQVHRGFARAWMEVRDKVTEALTRAAEALPPDWDRSVRIAGHSLGGAIATPAAAELGERGYTIRTMTYGASRVGNIAFVTWLTAQSHGAISRVTHGGDPVPHLPLMASGAIISRAKSKKTYRHHQQCNVGTLGLEVISHFYYFRDVDECGPLVPLKRHAMSLPEETRQAIQQEQVAAKAIETNYRILEEGKHCMSTLGLVLSHEVGHRIRGRSLDSGTEDSAQEKRQ